MKKFLVLYAAPLEVLEKWSNFSEEDQKKEIEDWTKWMEKNADCLVDAGNPAGKNIRVKKGGSGAKRNEICGYTIVKASSHEKAAKIFEDSPHLVDEGAYIEVMEINEMD